jgi:hypothetical protein
MRRLTTLQLLNHFGNLPDVRVSTPEGPRNIDSIVQLRSGDILVMIEDRSNGFPALSGEAFEIPAADIDTPMWDIF